METSVEKPIDIEEVSPDIWIQYEEHYRSLLADPVTRNKVPLLNVNALHHLQDNKLVRFRGMIQDMHNPEFYFETFELINRETKTSRLSSGKYRDTADVADNESLNYNSINMKSAERQTMVTISLPGLNEWAQKIEHEIHFKPHLIRPLTTSQDAKSAPHVNLKRSLDEDDVPESMEMGEASEMSLGNERKKCISEASQQNLNSSQSGVTVSHDHILNFPLPDVPGKVCLMKVYNQYDSLKLNDMVEVVGFLSVDPILGSEWNGKKNEVTGEDMDVETLTHNPPPSLVPRIHAVHIESLQHCNPLVHREFDHEKHLKEANEAREHLRLTLTELLFGDVLAADYMICYLISYVYIRRDFLTLGKLSLNISNIPCISHPQYTQQLYDILQQMVTKSYYLPLTVDNMNTLAFLPKKDYTCNRLTSGILQLSKNTHLVLDETKMHPGQLDSTGLANLKALQNMIETQRVKYDFHYYEMEFDCDIPTLILSEGKSLLTSDFHVKLEIDESNQAILNEIFDAARHYLKKDVLDKIRIYLTSMQMAAFTIDQEPEYIQEDFVTMRRNEDGLRENVTDEDLHKLLVLTRLISISKGHNTLTEECWNLAKGMEEQRLRRLIK